MRTLPPNYKVVVTFTNSYAGDIERDFWYNASGPDECKKRALYEDGTEYIRKSWKNMEVYYVAYGMHRHRNANKFGVLETLVKSYVKEEI